MSVRIRSRTGGILLVLATAGSGWVSAQVADSTLTATSTPVTPARLEVDISDRQLKVMVGEEELASYPVAVGTNAHETPTGTFSIRRIIWNPSWTPPNSAWARGRKPTPPGDPNNPMGRVKIFFSAPDYYIHGTENEASLGTAASHGCLRMSNNQVIELAKTVMEHGGEARPPSWFQRIVNAVRQTEEVRLTTPVQMTVRA